MKNGRDYLNTNRHGVYCYRRGVRAKFRPFLPGEHQGKRELTQSLETKDERIANSRMNPVETAMERIYQVAVVAHAEWVAQQGSQAAPPAADIKRQIAENDAYAARTLAALGPADDFNIYKSTGRMGLPIISSEPLPVGPQPVDVSTLEEVKQEQITINYVIEKYRIERGVNDTTVEGIKRDWQLLCDMTGLKLDSLIVKVTRPMLQEFKDKLFLHPANTRNKELMAMSFADRINYAKVRNADEDKSKHISILSKMSVSQKLGNIASILGLATEKDYIEANPSYKISVKVTAEERAMTKGLPYSKTELEAIFKHPKFSETKWGVHQWVPVLALHSGARIEELCALLIADVKEESDIWYLDLSYFDEDGNRVKKLKNFQSVRAVPLHHGVIALGFLQYWQEMKDKGETRLFPELVADDTGRVSANVSRWWSDQREVFKIFNPRKNFHSFRHLFADLCIDADLNVKTSFKLTGHSVANLGAGGSYGLGADLHKLASSVARIVIPVTIHSHGEQEARDRGMAGGPANTVAATAVI